METNPPIPFADLTLARRLERAEARSNASFVEARNRLEPRRNASWIEVAGTSAMFDGTASPLTQTFGLGIHQPVTDADLDALEGFFVEREAPVHHEVSPLADPTAQTLLGQRGYRAVEYTSVMYRPTAGGVSRGNHPETQVTVRQTERDEADLWARTSAEGWREFGKQLADFLMDVGRVNVENPGMLSFLAELEGQPVAAAAMFLTDDVALMAGAATIPAGRRRGAQLALLDHRLRYAAEEGCNVAMMCAEPGSASQRNAERNGFRIAYTRVKWGLPAD